MLVRLGMHGYAHGVTIRRHHFDRGEKFLGRGLRSDFEKGFATLDARTFPLRVLPLRGTSAGGGTSRWKEAKAASGGDVQGTPP